MAGSWFSVTALLLDAGLVKWIDLGLIGSSWTDQELLGPTWADPELIDLEIFVPGLVVPSLGSLKYELFWERWSRTQQGT